MPPSDDAAPAAVTELIVRFRRRYVHAVVRKAAVLAGLWVALICAAAWWLLRLQMMRAWSVGAPLAAGMLGLAGIAWWTRRHWVSEQGAAAQLDRTLGLEERLITAQEFASRPDASSLYPVLVHETATRAQTGHIRMPRALDRTSATIAILLLLVLILPRVNPSVVSPTPDARQPRPQHTPPSQSEEQRQQQLQQQQQPSQPAQPSGGEPQQPQSSSQPSPQPSPSSGGGPAQQSPQQPGGQQQPQPGQQGQQGQERGAGGQQGAGQASGTQDSGITGEQGQAQQHAAQPQGAGQSSGKQDAGKAGQQQGQRSQSGAQQQASAQQQQGAGNQQNQNQSQPQGQGQQSAGKQGQAQSMTQQQAGGKQGESPQGAGMSPGQQDAMKADIQKLLKDVSAELKNLQASLDDTNQTSSQAGTSTDPNIYGEAETLPESQGSLPVPIQLETDEAQTSRTRQGSGVGAASERAGRAAPKSTVEAVQLSSEPAQEPPTQHEAVPPDYQGVFDQIRQQPEGTP